MKSDLTSSDIGLNSQKYSGFFGISLGLFLIGTIISAYKVMGIKSIYICAFSAFYLITYSLIVLYLTRKKIESKFIKYFGILSLFFVLTIAKYSFVYGRIGYADVIKETMTFDLYFILIIFTAIYNDTWLTFFSGVLAALLYGTLILLGRFVYDMEFAAVPEANFTQNQIRIDIEIVKCCILIIVGILINIITTNINKLLEKVRNSEIDAQKQIEYKTRVIDDISVKSNSLMDMSVSQSRLEKSFNESSARQLDFANKLSVYINDLYNLARSVSDNISKQAEMTADLKNHVNNLRDWHDNASEISGKVQNYAGSINSLSIESTQDITESIKKIQIISKGTEKIQDFLTIINDITDRINLLSLNAAIEAARAGEYGKGFAVVADEISKLADATSNQSVEISKHLKNNIDDVKSGENYIQKTARSFNAIIENIKNTQEYLAQIYSIIEKLSSASVFLDEKVNKLIDFSVSIDSSSKEQASITEQIKSRIDELIQNSNLIIEGGKELTRISEITSQLSRDMKETVIK